MRINDRVQGLAKVKFWLVMLMACISASLGIWIGQQPLDKVSVPHSALDWLKSMGKALWSFYQEMYTTNRIAFWITILGVVICIVVGAYLYRRFKPKKHRPAGPNVLSDSVMGQIILYAAIVALLAAAIYAFENELLVLFLSIGFALLSLSTVGKIIQVLRDVYYKRNSEDYVYFERNKKRVLVVTTLIGMALVGLPLWLPGFWGVRIRVIGSAGELWGYYTALLSLTFISISVMSVLSDRSVVIYWDNIAEGRLIKPVFGSFAAFTYYSIGAAIGAGISVAARNTVAFVTFSLINISTIVVLTMSMVDVYYDREGKKERKVKELHDDLRDYTWYCKDQLLTGEALQAHRKKYDEDTGEDTGEYYTEAEMRNKRIGHRNYEEKMLLLCQHISRAYDDHDLMYLQEVYDLVVKNPQCFQSPNGRRVIHLLYCKCNEETWPLVTLSLRDLVKHMEKYQVRDEDPLAEGFASAHYGWNWDVLLWQSLAESPYLRQWLGNVQGDTFCEQELQNLIYSVLCRWVILYNDVATHGNKPGYLKPRVPASKAIDMLGIGDTLREIKDTYRECASLFKRKTKPAPEVLPYEYLKLTQLDDCVLLCAEREEEPDWDQLRTVRDTLWQDLVEDTPITKVLTQWMALLPENLSEDGQKIWQQYLQKLPKNNTDQ